MQNDAPTRANPPKETVAEAGFSRRTTNDDEQPLLLEDSRMKTSMPSDTGILYVKNR